MGEIGRKVNIVPPMMNVVVRGSAEKRQQSVQSPGQVVATVVVHRQPGVENVEEDLTEGVTVHQAGTDLC